MAKPFRLELEGMDKVLAAIAKADSEIAKSVDLELKAAATEIENQAARNVSRIPRGGDSMFTGRLLNGISSRKSGNLQYEITSNADYSAYIEFGTGAYVSVPSELQNYAAQFKGRGVKKVNLPARPFFFPAFYAVKQKLLTNIRNILKG